jgi:hypothetical protein
MKCNILPRRWSLSVTLLSVHPSAANFALDVTAPVVLALTPLHLLDADGTVAPTATHILTAVVSVGTGIAWPVEHVNTLCKFLATVEWGVNERVVQESHSPRRDGVTSSIQTPHFVKEDTPFQNTVKVIHPYRTRHQDRLSWRGPAAISLTDQPVAL